MKEDKFKELMKDNMSMSDYRTLGLAVLGEKKHAIKEKFRKIFKRKKGK